MADADIMVVGAGPVGMLAALLSAQHGLQVLLLEQSAERHLQSRAIGITPPSLEILRSIGLAGAFCEHGVAVRGAEAFGRRMRLGRLDFTGLNSEFRFVLSIPQHSTEALLELAVLSQPNIRFLRGHQVTACSEREGDVAVTGSRAAAAPFHFSGRYLLACDGGKSTVREALGIPCEVAPDRHTFLMSDFEDTTGWGQEARFFFTARGSVESFPLPDGKRRYVVRTPSLIREDSAGYLRAELLWRAGIDVAGARQFWESGFGVQRSMARTFCKGRTFLCGDAAHLMSPVGGQNMNTGFADAELAAWLAKVLLEKRAPQHLVLGLYDRVRRRAARAASRRAQCLMVAGASGGLLWSAIRNLATFIFLHVPLRQLLIHAIGMQSIPCRNLENCRSRIEKGLE